MSGSLVDSTDIDEVHRQIEFHLEQRDGLCWVAGPTGSGRRLLLERLRSRADVIALQPPPLEHADSRLCRFAWAWHLSR